MPCSKYSSNLLRVTVSILRNDRASAFSIRWLWQLLTLTVAGIPSRTQWYRLHESRLTFLICWHTDRHRFEFSMMLWHCVNVAWNIMAVFWLSYWQALLMHGKHASNLRGCKILKSIAWPGPRPFQGWLVVQRLTLDITCKQTKFDDSSFSRSRYLRGCEILKLATWPWPRPLGDIWSSLCGIRISAVHHLVLSQYSEYTRLTDRQTQTDRQTDRIAIAIPCVALHAVAWQQN